ncbi:hypothetical protein OCGS_2382 [Oceaniovalibus guishaninsula JLT2003]|uniref:Gene transfer agent protein n=1 Tax=Oceaniovalibus guishaninsula JLT2003 TaxID=1231392 RepID=K2I493_9RHOB|nr:DUF3168 domain-containing protein [Oceaniovalibus guishaninsula]EKE43650.1 hypothetical protein OCGS_2382 [Oceaniovalibus guishaninsula JLT2003]
MTYAMAAPLQAAVFQALRADPAVAALTGGAIHDAVPPGPVPGLYVTLGDEDVRERGCKDAGGARHDFTLRVVSDAAGFRQAKQAAAAICDALLAGLPPLPRGRIAGLWFVRARARRIGGGAAREIELRFRAQVMDE